MLRRKRHIHKCEYLYDTVEIEVFTRTQLRNGLALGWLGQSAKNTRRGTTEVRTTANAIRYPKNSRSIDTRLSLDTRSDQGSCRVTSMVLRAV